MMERGIWKKWIMQVKELIIDTIVTEMRTGDALYMYLLWQLGRD